MTKGIGAIAVFIFVAIFAFPAYYNIFSGGAGAFQRIPELKITKTGKCVEDAKWMRNNHMMLLVHTRDEVVREGLRQIDHTLTGCKSCHEKRGEFCDQCHEYVGIRLECWDCHQYPI